MTTATREPQTAAELEESFKPPAEQGRAGALAEAPTSLLAAIVGMARDPSVNIPALKELMAMQERLEERQARQEFIAAFARLSAKLPRVKKNGTIELITKQGENKGSIPFARWEDIDKAIRPLMVEEGFTLSFDSEPRQGDGGGLIVTGTLMHRDGHTRTAKMPLALDGGPGRNNLQAMGSTLSYGKRYCAEMLLNIVREGEDDDGKLGGTKFASTEQAAEIDMLLRETGSDIPKFLQHFEIADVRNLTAAQYIDAKSALMSKMAKAKRA